MEKYIQIEIYVEDPLHIRGWVYFVGDARNEEGTYINHRHRQ